MDFVSSQLINSRRFQVLQAIDGYIRKSIELFIDISYSGEQVTRCVGQLIIFYRNPSPNFAANGTKFTSTVMLPYVMTRL